MAAVVNQVDVFFVTSDCGHPKTIEIEECVVNDLYGIESVLSVVGKYLSSMLILCTVEPGLHTTVEPDLCGHLGIKVILTIKSVI